MKLYVITTETFWKEEIAAIHYLFEKGLERLHVRKPLSSRDEMKTFLEQIDDSYYARIVLHDHYDLMDEFDIKSIHLNQRNQHKYVEHCSMLVANKVLLSMSCHNLEETSKYTQFEYVFLSPVFDSISKSGYKKGFTTQQLMKKKKKGVIHDRVIALGGITADRIPVVRACGFGGVAVLGALWDADFTDGYDLPERFNKLKIKCEEA